VTKTFPQSIRCRDIFSYNLDEFDFRKQTIRILQSLDATLIGTFEPLDPSIKPYEPRLEDFKVPENSLRPRRSTTFADRQGDEAQHCLSTSVEQDATFLALFDSFVVQVVLPYFKERLASSGLIKPEETTFFFYQRPPTLRIQPGPSTRGVTAHSDSVYGHQDGELNFWMPLTDPDTTQTDIWAESGPGVGDFTPLGARLGQAVAFHGSSCVHYVPPNPTRFTRVSLDFRVGIDKYFDPEWKMRGTKRDHNRRSFCL